MSNHLDRSKFKSCSCGAHIESETTEVKPNYTWFGLFWLSWGVTAYPTDIVFNCDKCGQRAFEHITDKELIKYYIYYRKH